MTLPHVVQRGEYLASLAAHHGFLDYRAIWLDPANSELRRRRTNPQSLAPGDVVAVPARQRPAFERGTDRVHRLVAAADVVLLHFVFEDQSRKPYAGRGGQFRVAGPTASGGLRVRGPIVLSTDGQGALRQRVRGQPSEGEFAMDPAGADQAPAATFRYLVGELQPVDTTPGLRARLNNLGYFAGYGDDDTAQLEWAVEEFQCDENLPPKSRGLSTDRKRMLPTLNHLARRHGDMLPGEELT